MIEDGISARVRGWASARRLPDVHLYRWLALPDEDRAALLEVAERLKLRTGQFVTAFELLEEIAVREQDRVGAILTRPELRRVIDGSGSSPGRAHGLVEALRSIRFPRLADAVKSLANAARAMALPRGINVVLPSDLSSDVLRIEIVAHNRDELDKLIHAISDKRKELGDIVEALGGADEI